MGRCFGGVQSHIGLIVEEDIRPQKFRKSIEDATPGAQRLEHIIRNENNGETVYPVQPGMLTSFDDTTVFAFEGINNDTGKGVGNCSTQMSRTLQDQPTQWTEMESRRHSSEDSEFDSVSRLLGMVVWLLSGQQ